MERVLAVTGAFYGFLHWFPEGSKYAIISYTLYAEIKFYGKTQMLQQVSARLFTYISNTIGTILTSLSDKSYYKNMSYFYITHLFV